jgi:phosphatidylserine/phosphatidylglycerophosphate/cardiolipin synthase-like enzyme
MSFISLVLFVMTLVMPLQATRAVAYFSPDDRLEQKLIEQIDQEKRSISACIYTFTHHGIAKALIAARKRGVEVELIVDRSSVKVRAPLQKLLEAGVSVFVWDAEIGRSRRPLMHNKFCIFGGEKIWTGSFNWTHEAVRLHQENAIVLKDPTLASAFKGQFYTIKVRSCTPLASYVALHKKRVKRYNGGL